MEMNRRAAIAAAFALPAAAKAAPVPEPELLQPKRGFMLVGVAIKNDRVLDGGRHVPMAEWNRQHGTNWPLDTHGMANVTYSGCTGKHWLALSPTE